MKRKRFQKLTEVLLSSGPLLLILSIGISCSRINRESRESIQFEKNLRHGIVPLPKNLKLPHTPLKAPNKKRVARGKILYKNHCFSCHGTFGLGDGPKSQGPGQTPKDLINIIKTVPHFKFYFMLSKWKGKMPGWKNLFTEKEIVDLESYLIHLALNKNQ